MNKSKKLTYLILISWLSGILYGILFDLINYTIAEEYFTKNLFKENNIPNVFHNKWGTVITGIMDNWWIGILSFTGFFILFQKEPKLTIKSVIITTIVFIIISLIIPLIPPSFDLFIIWLSHVPYESFTIQYNKSVPASEQIHNIIGFFFVSAVRKLKYTGLTAGSVISFIVFIFLTKRRSLIC
ncbi:MAG: hypothetical protein J7604_20715 [Sporocytophaga sp.]|uniref:hypothetical protein n=1 Tax=Sporocytophaga sp. TaxID=2231183 RepID=UPI001B051316|nr:hypothetical protein [Sporocytophaga sp.]MBO9702647.1 hypothetical protein [Sporocytophaga sp.]